MESFFSLLKTEEVYHQRYVDRKQAKSGIFAYIELYQRTLRFPFFRSAAQSLQQPAQDPRFVGGQIGMVGILQTWTRDLRYHPHVHLCAVSRQREIVQT